MDVGRVTLVGPLKDQSFTCVSGHTCAFDSLGVWHPQLENQLLVMDTCGAERDVSFAGFEEPMVFAINSVTSHADRPGIASFATQNQVIVPGGSYRLCWYAGLTGKHLNVSLVADQRNFNVDAGQLDVIGPHPLTQSRTCVSGQSCVVNALTGTGASAWRIMVLDTCGPGRSNVTQGHATVGFPQSGLGESPMNFSESGNLTQWHGAFSATWRVITSGGSYRLCWCGSLNRPLTNVTFESNLSNDSAGVVMPVVPLEFDGSKDWCSDASRFLVDMGSLSVIGPGELGQSGHISGTCISGRRCTLGFRPEAEGQVLVLDTCGASSSLVPRFGWPSTNSSYNEITWGSTAISALGGQYRLCWCSGDGYNSSSESSTSFFRCSTAEDFLLDIGSLHLIGPGPSAFRTCISGMTCSFEFQHQPAFLGHSMAAFSVMLLDTCGISGINAQGLHHFGTAAVSISPSWVNSSSQLIASGGLYRLCWCMLENRSASCDLAKDHLVDAGSLLLLGPSAPQDRTCISGRSCQVKGIAVDGHDDKILILATCGVAAAAGTPAMPLNLTPWNATGWLDVAVSLTGGTYRLCWCSGWNTCEAAWDFQTDAGEMTILGPFGEQDRTCIAGMTCSVDIPQGLGLDLFEDRYMILNTCGEVKAGGLGLGAFGRGFGDVVTWDQLTAAGGQYRWCWCPSSLNVSGSCIVASDFTVDVGRLMLQAGVV